MLKFDQSFHKQSLCQPYCVSYLDLRRHFQPYPKSVTGLMGHPRVIIVVNDIPWRFCTGKNKNLWHILFVNVHFLLNSLHSLLLKLLYGTLFHKYSHGSKNISVPNK